jgi:hypothetical protein
VGIVSRQDTRIGAWIARVSGLAVLLVLCFCAPAWAATFVVDNGGDGHDRNLGDAVCDGSPNGEPAFCTLRAAIEEANALEGEHTVDVEVPDVLLTLGAGGAVEISANVTINGRGATRTTIRQSLSPGSGDRVFDVMGGADVTITGVEIRDGEANPGNNFFGGNIRSAGSLRIEDSSVTGGSGYSAGGIANTGGTLTVSHSAVWGNSAVNGGGDAGAILNFGTAEFPAVLHIQNSTITGNNARLGGGVTSYNNPENTVSITTSTIAFNESGDRGSGGGLAIGSGSASVDNSIIAKNTSVSPDNQNCSADPGSTINSLGYNLENAADCGFTGSGDEQNADPLLGALALNGGETRTHALAAGSPAIDTGSSECPADDQRRVGRPQGGRCDKGAFEFEFTDATPPETEITAGPSGPTTDHTPTFVFSAGEPGSRFECSIDGGPFVPCNSPFTTPELTAGRHTLAVRAVDAAGNADPTPSVFEFEVEALTVQELPDPVPGVSVNVQQVSGTVLIGIPSSAARAARSGRASQKGITFVPLTAAEQIPVGSFLDTRRGTVRLQSATNAAGARQTGDFLSSIFQVRQSKRRSAKGLTDLVLKGGSFNRCGAARGKRAGASLSRRAIRRLRANARGRFRTSGRNSSATVRGTRWETIDRCDGTLTKVQRGTVIVRDFRKKKNVVLKAGKSYLARARR